MEQDLYGFADSDVDRLRRICEAYEGGARLKQADTSPRKPPTPIIQTYLAYTLTDISAASGSTLGDGEVTFYGAKNAATSTTTTTSATFVIPAVGSTVSVNVGATAQLAVNERVLIGDGTHEITARVTAIADGTHFTAETLTVLLGAAGNTMNSGANVSPYGYYQITDKIVKDIAFNITTNIIAVNTYVILAREPYSGKLIVLVGAPSSDHKVAVSSDDTSPDFLENKLTAGANITLTETSEGGNETMTIAAAGGSGQTVTVTTYSTHGTNTFSKQAGTRWIRRTVVGAGGGGGGCASPGAGKCAVASGGAGGGTTIYEGPATELAASETVVVGVGGAGGAAGANDGVSGTASTFTTTGVGGPGTLTGAGGQNGVQGAATAGVSFRNGGAAGGGANGNMNLFGGDGGDGYVMTGSSDSVFASRGGSSYMSGEIAGIINQTGFNGRGSGAGGAGAALTSIGTAKAGGNGIDGFVMVEEFS